MPRATGACAQQNQAAYSWREPTQRGTVTHAKPCLKSAHACSNQACKQVQKHVRYGHMHGLHQRFAANRAATTLSPLHPACFLPPPHHPWPASGQHQVAGWAGQRRGCRQAPQRLQSLHPGGSCWLPPGPGSPGLPGPCYHPSPAYPAPAQATKARRQSCHLLPMDLRARNRCIAASRRRSRKHTVHDAAGMPSAGSTRHNKPASWMTTSPDPVCHAPPTTLHPLFVDQAYAHPPACGGGRGAASLLLPPGAAAMLVPEPAPWPPSRASRASLLGCAGTAFGLTRAGAGAAAPPTIATPSCWCAVLAEDGPLLAAVAAGPPPVGACCGGTVSWGMGSVEMPIAGSPAHKVPAPAAL